MHHYVWSMMFVATCLINNMHAMETDIKEQPNEQYIKLLHQVINHNRSDLEKAILEDDNNILIKTHDWGIQNEPELLKQSYKNLVDRYGRCIDITTKSDNIHIAFSNILDRYAEIDHENAIKKLCSEIYPLPKLAVSHAYPITLLSILKRRDPVQFKITTKKLIKHQFEMMFQLGLMHPELMATLQDEKMNPHALIKTALTDHPDKLAENFTIIMDYDAQFHTTLEQEIVEALPVIAKKHYLQSPTLQKLLQSPSLKIRNSTLSALLLCIADNEQNQSKRKIIIDDIFDNEALLPLQGEELYQSLFDSFQQLTDYTKHYGMQLLIKRLAQDCKTPFFVNIIARYFNIPKLDPTTDMIDEALTYACDHKTLSLSELNFMLSIAKETDCTRFIHPETVSRLKTGFILDESIHPSFRAQFLNELFVEHHVVKKQTSPILVQEIEQLPSSPFAQYAYTLLYLLDPDLRQTDYFDARASLFKLKKEYPDYFPSEPTILNHYWKALFVAVKEPQYQKADQESKPKYIHLEVQKHLEMPQFPAGPHFFGYVEEQTDEKNYYQLHACNKRNGIPIWISPIQNNKKHAYTIDTQYVYCATDEGNIIQIDLATGDQLQEFSIPDRQLTINKLHVCGSDILCAVENKSIALFNVKTKDFQIIPLPEESYPPLAVSTDNRLIIPTTENLFILNNDGTYKQIPHHSKHRFYDPIQCAGNSEFIIYQKRDKPNQSLVSLKTDTYNKSWEYPLDAEAVQIKISPLDSTIFILTKYYVLALNPHADDEHRLLWRTKLHYDYGSEIDSIHIGQDGSALYGFKKSSGELFFFDVQSGLKQFLYKTFLGTHSKIVGDFKGKLYLQGSLLSD